MSSTSDKVAGAANTAVGHIKEAVGKAIGSEKLQAEGVVQELKGEAQKASGDVKDAVKHGANKVADAIDKI